MRLLFLFCLIFLSSGKSLHSQDQGVSSSPLFSKHGGFYTGSQSVELTSISQGAEIRFTTDGKEPDSLSALYTGPITITNSTALRARIFETGKEPGEIITQTFFIDEEINLPVISIATDPDNFFDNQKGIYITGTNGTRGACDPTIRNLNQDWERPVNIELYEKDGTQGINQQAGIKIYGGCSRTRFPEKSLALYARNEYGKGSFDYQLFPDKNIYKFESFVLRSSADDQVSTFMRDALAQYVSIGDMDLDIQAYRPAVVFLNGEYWGIHDIREKISENYFRSNYNIDENTINILEGNGYASYGSSSGYTDLMNFIADNNLANRVNYNFVQSQMDIDEFINYEILHIYLAERDWPGNNIKFWNSGVRGHEKWRWICYDLDQTFVRTNANTLADAIATNGPSWPNPPWSTFLLRNLLLNDDFRNRFIQSYAFYLSTTFKPDHLTPIVQKFKERLEPEIPRHVTRWGGQLDPDFNESWTISPTFSSLEQWLGNVDVIFDFINNRPAYAINHLKAIFGLSGMSVLTMRTNLPGAGNLTIYNRKVPQPEFKGDFFRDVPIRAEAISNAGYKFSHWEFAGTIHPTDSASSISFTLQDNMELTAIFEEYTGTEHFITINEINYNSSPLYNSGDWLEIFNNQTNTLDLSGWTLRDSNEKNSFVFPQGTRISSKRYLTVCEDIDLLYTQFPHTLDCIGNTGFGFKNEGEVLALYNADNQLIDSVHYSNVDPWPELADGLGYSMILKSPDLDNDLAENWTSLLNGSPGRNNQEVTGIPENPIHEDSGNTIRQNYPNPCKSATTINYTLAATGCVSIKIYTVTGTLLDEPVHADQSPGSYTITLNVESLTDGIYFYSMRVGDYFVGVRKLIVSH